MIKNIMVAGKNADGFGEFVMYSTNIPDNFFMLEENYEESLREPAILFAESKGLTDCMVFDQNAVRAVAPMLSSIIDDFRIPFGIQDQETPYVQNGSVRISSDRVEIDLNGYSRCDGNKGLIYLYSSLNDTTICAYNDINKEDPIYVEFCDAINHG